jgi:DNA-binding NtrC family response regulator
MWLESSQADALTMLKQPAARAENSPVLGKNHAPTVLIVDGEALLRWSLAETLRDAGFQIVEAGDGASAMRAFSSGVIPTDAVLLDLHLPDSGDLRLLTAIRAQSPTTPVILMTAYGSSEVQAEACGRGAFMVLDKPFEMSAISPILEHALHAVAS